MKRFRGPVGAWGVRVALATLVGVVALAFGGCEKPSAGAAPPPPVVGVVDSRRMDVPVTVSPNGTTRALEDVTIRARVRGFLTERHFAEGAFVKKGQLLLVIDEEPYKIALRSAKARHSEADAALRKAEASKAREVATSQVELSKAQRFLAQAQERRSRSLLARNAGTAEDVDKVEADLRRWEAQVGADLANSEQAKADYDVGIASTRAQVEAALSAVQDADLNLGYCRMYAAIDGRIGQARVKVGNLVGPDAGGGGRFTDLATIQQLDPMGVEVLLSSRDLERITQLVASGLSVKVTRPGRSGDVEHPHDGTFYFIDNAIDETTSTFLAKAQIPNPDASLLPGAYVKLRMMIDRLPNAVVVPAPSVTETDSGPVVYLVGPDGKVAVQKVEVGPTFEGMRVIAKGLETGVPVIVEGLQSIRPGLAVQAEPVILPRQVADAAKPAG